MRESQPTLIICSPLFWSFTAKGRPPYCYKLLIYWKINPFLLTNLSVHSVRSDIRTLYISKNSSQVIIPLKHMRRLAWAFVARKSAKCAGPFTSSHTAIYQINCQKGPCMDHFCHFWSKSNELLKRKWRLKNTAGDKRRVPHYPTVSQCFGWPKLWRLFIGSECTNIRTWVPKRVCHFGSIV